jgi:hypothetical protein
LESPTRERDYPPFKKFIFSVLADSRNKNGTNISPPVQFFFFVTRQ